jgi:hypothetical protein
MNKIKNEGNRMMEASDKKLIKNKSKKGSRMTSTCET